MVVSQKRKGPKAGQKSNTNLKPEFHHSFKNASTVDSLETNKGDRLPTGSKSTNGKRKTRCDLDISLEIELNPMGNKVSGLVGLSLSRTTQSDFPIGPTINFNQGLSCSKPVATSVKGKKTLHEEGLLLSQWAASFQEKEKNQLLFLHEQRNFPPLLFGQTVS